MNTRLPGQFAVLAEVDDLLDEPFAFVVARMRLAGEDELDGPLLVVREFHDVVELLENQRRAFVGGEPARETDGQRVGIQQMVEADEIARRRAAGCWSNRRRRTNSIISRRKLVAQRPEFLVGDKIRVGHFLPEFG